jgi:PAS domain S-box-containing protein
MTLRGKLVLAFVAVTAIPFLALVWMLSISTIRQSETFVGARLQDSVSQAARLIDQFMISSLREMKAFAAAPIYGGSDIRAISGPLEQLTYFYPYYSEISLVTAEGIVVASSNSQRIGSRLEEAHRATAAELARAVRGESGSVFVTFADNHAASSADLHLELLAPVRDAHGNFIGVLAADLATSHFQNLLHDIQLRLPDNEHVHLLGESGHVLISTDPQTKLLERYPEAERAFNSRLASGQSGHLIYETPQGNRAMAGYAHLPGYGETKAGQWRLVATATYAHIMEPVTAAFKKGAALLAVALVAAVLAGAFLARVLTRPIQNLTAVAQNIAAGNFNARAVDTGLDETGTLATAFNAMAGTLQRQVEALEHSRDALEHRVTERTRELQLQILDRDRSEEALRKSNERFEMTMLATTDCIWDWDLRADDVWWNDNFCKVFGYAPEEVGNGLESWSSRIHPDDLAMTVNSIHEAVWDGSTLWNGEYRFRRADGTYAWVVDRGYVVRDEDRQALRMIGALQDITRRREAETEVEAINKQLLDASRRAGMAEIASNVLHNVGNVLNSVNVSVNLVTERTRKSRAMSLAKVVGLLKEHESDLGTFITSDPKGRHLPAYLSDLATQIGIEQKEALQEMDSLRQNISHINEIVTMQQSYATMSGVKEVLNPLDLVEDSLRMNSGALSRHGVTLIREFDEVPHINVDKHRVLQILVNLVRNAKYACDESGHDEKRLTLRVNQTGDRLRIAVIDNGVGIPAENLTRIFNHGFTTRKTGHGFGLHSGALAAKELGGSLTAHSDGPGRGATFILELPLELPMQERKTA